MGENWPSNPIEALERLNAKGVPLTFETGVELVLAQHERSRAPAWTREVPKGGSWYGTKCGAYGVQFQLRDTNRWLTVDQLRSEAGLTTP